VCRRRLKGLCSERSGAAYLRRLSFRNADNKPVAVFAATTLGYGVAGQLLGRAVPRPPEDVKAFLLARIVRLNELYLALAQGPVSRLLSYFRSGAGMDRLVAKEGRSRGDSGQRQLWPESPSTFASPTSPSDGKARHQQKLARRFRAEPGW